MVKKMGHIVMHLLLMLKPCQTRKANKCNPNQSSHI